MLSFRGKLEPRSQGKVSEHPNKPFVLRAFADEEHSILSSPASSGKADRIHTQGPPKKRKLRGDILYIVGTPNGYCDVVIYNNKYTFVLCQALKIWDFLRGRG